MLMGPTEWQRWDHVERVLRKSKVVMGSGMAHVGIA